MAWAVLIGACSAARRSHVEPQTAKTGNSYLCWGGHGGVRPHGLVDNTFCRSILSDCTSLLTIFTSPTYWCASDANDVMSVAPQACVPKLSAAADRRKHIRTRSVRREPSTIFSSRVSSSLKYASCDRPQAGGGTPRNTVAIANTPSSQQRRRPPN